MRMVAHKITHRSFQPAEAEIVVRLVDHWPWKIECARISRFCQSVNFRPGRIRKSEQLADFVKAFTGCIVHGRTKHAMLQFRFDMDKHRVAATDNERDVRLKRIE